MGSYIGLATITLFILYCINWVLFAPSIDKWRTWFAWYPIKVNGQFKWLCLVQRKLEFVGSSSETCIDHVIYRNIKNV